MPVCEGDLMNEKWSKKEIEYLTTHANMMTVEQLATGLDGRTVGGIRCKLSVMGMSAKLNPRRRYGVKLRIKRDSPLWGDG